MKRAVTGVLCLILAAFTGTATAGEVSLFAAASLKEALNELADGYVRTHPAVKIIRNFGGSGALAKQIENGAPADLFISANREWMEYLKERHLIGNGSVVTFAGNTLVFAGTAERKVSSLQHLTRLEKIAIGSPKSVPAGEYAMDALRKTGLDRQLAKKLVMARDVRECLMYAERGEVDGAFVYRTDILLAKRLRILFVVPPELYPPIVYPQGITPAGAKKSDAVAFSKFLQSAGAQAVLTRYGFVPK